MQQLKKVYIPKTPKREYFIKKILIKNDWEQVDIIYQSWGEGSEKETKFICKEKPSPSFTEALAQLISHVHIICGLDTDAWAISFVSEVKFKEIDGGEMATITAKCEIDDYTVTVSTPWIFLQDELLDKLGGVVAETEEYVSGKRAQLSLLED